MLLKLWGDVTNVYRTYIKELPWVRAGAIVALVTGGLALLSTKVLDYLKVDIRHADTGIIVAAAIVILYFLMVAVLIHEQLQVERRLRRQDASFWYDKRGTLYNGTEPNIAFRIKTFSEILKSLGAKVGMDQLRPILRHTGEVAANDFAEHLPDIYDKNIRSARGGLPWDELDFKGRLYEWLEYDSRTGWGVLAGEFQGSRKINVSITHHRKLYDGDGGRLFGEFLAGYCRTVLAAILARSADSIRTPGIRVRDGEIVEIDFELT